ncbi:MAG: hypothetical protein P8J79_10795 [Halioglobus sp.]|nr:hypothetical protein [Halioglobus sp.]
MFFKHIKTSEVPLMAGAIVGACREGGWALDVQPRLLGAIFSALFNFDEDFRTLPAATLEEVASAFPHSEQRREIVDLMLTCELCLHQIPAELSESIDRWAAYLGVNGIDLTVARELAQGAQARAQFDLYRNGFWGACTEIDPAFTKLIEANGAKAFALTINADPVESARWEALEHCPPGSLGRGVWDFYQQRNFIFPGTPGAVSKGESHHDWVHVLSDYGTSPMGEVEVGAFRMTTTDDAGAALTFIAGQLAFYQGGIMPSALTGLHADHILERPGGPERVADALRRGRECTFDTYHMFDFFEVASEPLEALRQRWNFVPKSVNDSPSWDEIT